MTAGFWAAHDGRVNVVQSGGAWARPLPFHLEGYARNTVAAFGLALTWVAYRPEGGASVKLNTDLVVGRATFGASAIATPLSGAVQAATRFAAKADDFAINVTRLVSVHAQLEVPRLFFTVVVDHVPVASEKAVASAYRVRLPAHNFFVDLFHAIARWALGTVVVIAPLAVLCAHPTV